MSLDCWNVVTSCFVGGPIISDRHNVNATNGQNLRNNTEDRNNK